MRIVRFIARLCATAVILCAGRDLAAGMVPDPVPDPAGQSPTVPLEPDDWYWHGGQEQQHTEFWTAIVHDTSGYILYLSYLRTNFGMRAGNAGIALSLTAPDGTVTRLNLQYTDSQFVEERTGESYHGRITLADEQTITFGATHRLQAKFDDLSLDITLTPWIPGYRFGDGRVEVDPKARHYMRYLFLVPRADASGRLTVGDKTFSLNGAGYLEHLVVNRSATFWARRFYVMNVFAEDHTLHYLGGFPMETHSHLNDSLAYLVLSDRSGVRLASRSPTLSFRDATAGPDGCQWPKELRVSATSGVDPTADTLQVRWRTDEPHDAYIVLEQLGWALRRLVTPIVGNPVFLRFANAYEMRVTLDGKRLSLKGRALHQVVCLR